MQRVNVQMMFWFGSENVNDVLSFEHRSLWACVE